MTRAASKFCRLREPTTIAAVRSEAAIVAQPAALGRFCSGTLTELGQLYSARSGRGYFGRVYFPNEETGIEGRAFGTLEDGTTKQLPRMGLFSYENVVPAANRSDTTLVMGLAESAPVKLSLLRVTNTGDRSRRLTLTAYAEWTLGVLREHSRHQVQTALEAQHRAILARNRFDPGFAHTVAFFGLSEELSGHTADRREFLGRNGSVEAPAGLGAPLAGVTGPGPDPCAVLRSVIQLAPGEHRDIAVVLGAADGRDAAVELLERFGGAEAAREAIAANRRCWLERLSVIAVRTPEPTFDLLVNRWTLYQAISCRMKHQPLCAPLRIHRLLLGIFQIDQRHFFRTAASQPLFGGMEGDRSHRARNSKCGRALPRRIPKYAYFAFGCSQGKQRGIGIPGRCRRLGDATGQS